ncbi:MAG TPA: hypothetical protein VMZ24_05115 [Patescibacteria group bacterium]|jgi:hypothetical protein|nr:hypothetical protein [Patescibacteria group bacterium]
MAFDPVTIIVVVVALVALWFLFRILLSLTAAVFRIGCIVLIVGGIVAVMLYFMGLISF